jgi:hypothetical protein
MTLLSMDVSPAARGQRLETSPVRVERVAVCLLLAERVLEEP